MRMNRRWMLGSILLGLSLVPFGLRSAEGNAAGKTRVLVVTGGHDFEREPFFKMFKDNADVTFQAVEHPRAYAHFRPDAAGQYDVIVLYDMVQDITPEAKEDFVNLLKRGKGLVALHHCLASHQKWPEYERIIGGKYFLDKRVENGVEKPGSTYQHDVRMKVRVADASHPVTQGVTDFEILDETYGGFGVQPDIQPLLTTSEPTSSPTIGWAKTYDKARVVYLALGHDHAAFENPQFRKLLAQAIRWTAEKK